MELVPSQNAKLVKISGSIIGLRHKKERLPERLLLESIIKVQKEKQQSTDRMYLQRERLGRKDTNSHQREEELRKGIRLVQRGKRQLMPIMRKENNPLELVPTI